MAIWRIKAPLGLLACALSGVTACATTQAPHPPAPAEVRPAAPDAIRFLTQEYDVRFAAVPTGALVDVFSRSISDAKLFSESITLSIGLSSVRSRSSRYRKTRIPASVSCLRT